MDILWVSEFPPEKGGIGDYSFHVVNDLAARGFDIDVLSTVDGRPDGLNEEISVIGSVPESVSGWQEHLSADHDVVSLQFPGVPSKHLTLHALLRKKVAGEALLTLHEVPERMRFLPLLQNFDHFAFLSDIAEEEFRDAHQFYLKLRSWTSHRLPYQGADPDIAARLDAADHDLRIDPDRRTLVCPGFIVGRKRYHRVVEAMPEILEEHPDVELVLAGGPHRHAGTDYLDRIRDTVAAEGLEDRVTITGVLEDEDAVYAHIRAADATVLPYRDIYQSGILARSLALGTPPIVSPIPGLRSQVERYGGRVLDDTEPGTIAAAATAEFEDASQVDAETVREDLSWERNADRYAEIFEQMA